MLRELPNQKLREFGREAYAGDRRGSGLNLRSGVLTPGLGMATTEVLIRTHTHLAFYAETGSFQLPTANSAKRSEMLLAAHTAAGAVSLSKTAAVAAAGETVVAVRHLNVPVLMRIGMLALTVRSDAATRDAAGPTSWSQLLEEEAATWTLSEAIALAEILDEPWPTSLAL